MEKFLFTDGSGGVKEVQSQEELEELIGSTAQPDKSRVWLFNSNEWIGYAAYRKMYPAIKKKDVAIAASIHETVPVRVNGKKSWLKKFLFLAALVGGAFLVFNFTKIKWKKADPVNTVATRPNNVPLMDIDSLISDIEANRGTSLDRSTKTNLRLRNTWPERIELKLHSEKETSSAGSRFFNINLSIDNTTGFNLDNAVVKLLVWRNKEVSVSDTLRFGNIRYDKQSSRAWDAVYRGDSISVSFESIRAKAFNFCYSAAVKNNSGNYNDRWFCRE
ncbi:MAG: hypothetical protein HOP10_11200 [Chitinophagaceae bacterium]|nr:hypothetical protein [Chitinophagaceae bacterium]